MALEAMAWHRSWHVVALTCIPDSDPDGLQRWVAWYKLSHIRFGQFGAAWRRTDPTEGSALGFKKIASKR